MLVAAELPDIPTPRLQGTDLLIGLGIAVGAYLLGKLVSLVASKIMRARGRSRSFAAIFSTIFRWVATALGWSVALVVAFPSVNFAGILSGLGLTSLVIGIAAQSILADLFSGIMMVVREPFREGDQIEVSGIKGTIRIINLRETVVRTFAGTQVVIPNSKVHGASVRVQTGYEQRMLRVDVGVAYETDFDLVHRVLLDAVRELPQTLDDPAPAVRVSAINPKSVGIAVSAWVGSTQLDEVDALDALIPAVIGTLRQHDIEMPTDYGPITLVEAAQGST
ncbi:Mechanosensitive ion channel [Modestobacter italicus]|uniref:Mechanosensitive ion channel n=1 Tax=Modestobacter italicus (strain DSM 44449 / CECT 9708 / BC 501) TaxID=2732864 RepID=I4EYJ7_MODI5|nr:Mechanosensitive ion channel [Modestobacter marinus]